MTQVGKNDGQLRLYRKGISSDLIGEEHGVTKTQYQQLAEETAPVIQELNERRAGGAERYRDLPFDPEIAKQVKALAAELRDGVENLVVLGIGGSALGSIALQTALNPRMYNLDEKQRRGPRLFVFDNVDPEEFGSFLDWIDDKLDKTVFNVISKSGRTAETAAQFLIIHELLRDRLGPAGLKQQVVATTDSTRGTLREIVNDAALKSLEVPDGVGGRFSVLSAVGLFPAAMCGIDIDALLAGAREMDVRVKGEKFSENPAAVNAAVSIHYYRRGKKASVMMPYGYALKDLADWYRQLWAESLGKAKDIDGNEVFVGPTPIKALGTTDQHSQVQLYREGPNDKVYTFLTTESVQRDIEIGSPPNCAPELGFLAGKKLGRLLASEQRATEYALLVSQRPCLSIVFPEVNAHTIGQFIYLYEVSASIAGMLLRINPYDQPAVELGKEATFALMGKPGHEEFVQEIKRLTEVDDRYIV